MLIQDIMVVAGGIGTTNCTYFPNASGIFRSDIKSYNFTARQWSTLTSLSANGSTTMPSTRFIHGAFQFDTCMVMFGGAKNSTPSYTISSSSLDILDDMWALDVVLKKWIRINATLPQVT